MYAILQQEYYFAFVISDSFDIGAQLFYSYHLLFMKM